MHVGTRFHTSLMVFRVAPVGFHSIAVSLLIAHVVGSVPPVNHSRVTLCGFLIGQFGPLKPFIKYHYLFVSDLFSTLDSRPDSLVSRLLTLVSTLDSLVLLADVGSHALVSGFPRRYFGESGRLVS